MRIDQVQRQAGFLAQAGTLRSTKGSEAGMNKQERLNYVLQSNARAFNRVLRMKRRPRWLVTFLHLQEHHLTFLGAQMPKGRHATQPQRSGDAK